MNNNGGVPMSLKTKVLKDVRRRVRRQKDQARMQVVTEILQLPFKNRLKLAWSLLFRTKMKKKA